MWDIKPTVCWWHRASAGSPPPPHPPRPATHKSISDHRPHLWTDPLHSIHHNDAPITDANRCWYFGGEIHVARGVYQIYQVLLITWNKIWRHTFSCADKQASSCKPGKTLLRLNKSSRSQSFSRPLSCQLYHYTRGIKQPLQRTLKNFIRSSACTYYCTTSTYCIIKLSMR